MDTNWLRNELIRIVKEAKGREEGRGKEGAAFNERAQFTIGEGGSPPFSYRSFELSSDRWRILISIFRPI